ncbi:MAG: GNAT family N-acetyltransferase [Acidobacteriota bacterium]|nr:GNAT family N-acetyltransferase [Acidobacteriota bacterium]
MTLVRRATNEDLAALSSLAARLFPLGCVGTSEADLAAYIATELTPARFGEYLADPNLVLLLAEDDGAPVGYLMLALRSVQELAAAHADAATLGELRKLYVDPAHHGRGAAQELMHAALQVLQDSGAAAVWLSTYSLSLRAHAFYTRQGFVKVGEKLFQVGSDAQRDFVFLRQLS